VLRLFESQGKVVDTKFEPHYVKLSFSGESRRNQKTQAFKALFNERHFCGFPLAVIDLLLTSSSSSCISVLLCSASVLDTVSCNNSHAPSSQGIKCQPLALVLLPTCLDILAVKLDLLPLHKTSFSPRCNQTIVVWLPPHADQLAASLVLASSLFSRPNPQ
jgi:hypothetical protein